MDVGRSKEKIIMDVAGPFLISSKEQRAEYMHIHPNIRKMPNGRLILSINKDRDIHDSEFFTLMSDNLGKTWKETDDHWPIAKYPGAGTSFNINDEDVLASLSYSFESEKKGTYILPTWFSRNGGNTWGEMQACQVEIPHVEPVDIYNSLDRERLKAKINGPAEAKDGFFKTAPPANLQVLFEKFSKKRAPGISTMIKISDDHILGLVTLRCGADEQCSVAVVESKDKGHSWQFVTIAARFRESYIDKAYRRPDGSIRKVDGFCEPSMIRFDDGELLMMLRMGSYYPLYEIRSKDNGRSWSKPKKSSITGILPRLVKMQNGIVALAAGRPNITVNFSLDRGHSWKYQIKIFESSGVNTSTCNTDMIELENRLLLFYDLGNEDKNIKDTWLRYHQNSKIIAYSIGVDILY